MSDGKHTPGPWVTEVMEEATGLPATYITSGGGWANSGTVGRRTVAVVGHWTDRPNPDADARLIALAPEMLEALEEWVGMVERDEKIRTRHVRAARALIRRARGEEVTR